jgi:Kef-type K+ transport system membrane component KefB
MDHLEVHQFLGLLVVMLGVAKLLGSLAQRIGQPAVLGELLARVILVGMIPRGEVGLIFAQTGLDSEVLDAGLFSAVTPMVMVTTFLAPPLLKLWFPPVPADQPVPQPEGIEQLVCEP